MRRLASMDNLTLIVLFAGLALSGACVGFTLNRYVPQLQRPWTVITLAVLAFGFGLARANRRHIQSEIMSLGEAKSEVEDLSQHLHRAMQVFQAPDHHGVVVGHVVILPVNEQGDGAVSVEVKERCEDGWHDYNKAGEVAVVLTEIANELRQRAMNEASGG